MTQNDSEARPTDPPFLLVMLLCAHRVGDKRLERLARGWLADQGIRVILNDGKQKHMEGGKCNPNRR